MKIKRIPKYCERLLSRGMSVEDIIPLLKTRSSRNKNYWIERGYTDSEAQSMAKSRMPGTMEYYTILKNKSETDSKILVDQFQKKRIHTEENFVKRYGQTMGLEKWKSYCQKQKVKNTFDYKRKKFGWTKKQFDEYNKSRSVTLNNLIDRHGDEKGKIIWDSYKKKQSYTKSKEYVVNKYGLDEWEKLCYSKSHTYESFLERCGGNVEKATNDFNEYCKKISKTRISGSSKIANDLFLKLVNRLIKTEYNQFYCQSHNQEWYINIRGYGCIFLDFFLKETGKVIEFYGDYWHANPTKYKIGTTINLGSGGIKNVEDVWEYDKMRINVILTVPYIRDVKIVWESEYREDPNKIIDECYNYIIK